MKTPTLIILSLLVTHLVHAQQSPSADAVNGVKGVKQDAVQSIKKIAPPTVVPVTPPPPTGVTQPVPPPHAAQGVNKVDGIQATRTLYTGHSFAGASPTWLVLLAKQAGITEYENLGRQALGGSRVIDHWKLAEARNQAKAGLIKGGVDVLTLSPNMQMPDEGIDLFVDLALKHNPNIRVLVQGSWMTWDGLGKDGITNAERDARPVSEIRDRTAQHLEAIRTQLRATNARIGRDVCVLIPCGTAVVRLRELIAEGKLPGFERPSQLFVDDLGHACAAVLHLNAYLYYVSIFHRDPRGLTGLGTNGWTKTQGTPRPELKALLQKIAWETMLAEPMSGIQAP